MRNIASVCTALGLLLTLIVPVVSQAQSQALPLAEGVPAPEVAPIPEVAPAPEVAAIPEVAPVPEVAPAPAASPATEVAPASEVAPVLEAHRDLELVPVLQEEVGESLRMTMSSGAPNQYFFRGLLQSDKGFLWQSNSNLDVALYDSKEFKLIIPVGFWFSVHPGDKAKTGKGPAAWYESRLSGGIAAEGRAYRADLRLVVYSSPSGSFEDVYELLLKLDMFDDVVFAKGNDTAGFRGFFPSVTLASELKGARDGRDSGLFAEFALAPRARLLATKDLWIDAVVPLAIGLGLSKYYQLVDRGDTTPTNHVLGYASGGLLFDIVPRFLPARLGMYSILPSLTVLLPTAAKDAQAHVDAVEFVAKIDSMLRF